MGASDAKIDVVRGRRRRGAAEAPKNFIARGLGLRLTGSQRVGGGLHSWKFLALRVGL